MKKSKNKTIILHIILSLIAILSSCAKEAAPTAQDSVTSEPLHITVSILPQQYLVEQLVGDAAVVSVMVPPGKSPATYEPTTKQLAELSQADVYFTIGVSFEQALIPTIQSTLPELPVIHMDAGIKKRIITEEHADEEGEEHADEEIGALDPHIWMSPILAAEALQNAYFYLIAKDPGQAELYTARFNHIKTELEALDRDLMNVLEFMKGSTFFVYHPAFGYFADRYGLIQKAIETGGKEPTPKQLESIIQEAKDDNVSFLFVQPEFSEKSARVIADAVGCRVLTISALDKDYMVNLRNIALALSRDI